MKAFLPAIAWSGIIFYLSVTSGGVPVPQDLWDIFQVDKLGHAVFYCILTLLLYRGFYKIGKLERKRIIWSILISISFGTLMEFVQYAFFPNRYFEVLDIIANIIGSITSLIVLKFFIK